MVQVLLLAVAFVLYDRICLQKHASILVIIIDGVLSTHQVHILLLLFICSVVTTEGQIDLTKKLGCSSRNSHLETLIFIFLLVYLILLRWRLVLVL